MKAKPGSIPGAKITDTLVLIQAFGEINHTPAAELAAILSQAEKDLRGRP